LLSPSTVQYSTLHSIRYPANLKIRSWKDDDGNNQHNMQRLIFFFFNFYLGCWQCLHYVYLLNLMVAGVIVECSWGELFVDKLNRKATKSALSNTGPLKATLTDRKRKRVRLWIVLFWAKNVWIILFEREVSFDCIFYFFQFLFPTNYELLLKAHSILELHMKFFCFFLFLVWCRLLPIN
jgi:hypothetical protein